VASSQTEVVNIALTELGADLIVSLNDPVKAAILAKTNWDSLLRSVIRAYPWNFAIGRQTLSPDATAPVDLNGDWTYQFTLPPESIRVLSTDLSRDDWVIEGRKLLCNTDTITIRFLQAVDDVTQWDDCFTQAFAARLGHLLAYPLVQSAALKDSMWTTYKQKLSEARSIDAQEGRLEMLTADEWTESRV
jgi:hypothetical protein